MAHLYDLRNIDPQFVNEPIPQSILDENHLTATVTADAFQVGVDGGEKYPGQTFEGFTFMGGEGWLGDSETAAY